MCLYNIQIKYTNLFLLYKHFFNNFFDKMHQNLNNAFQQKSKYINENEKMNLFHLGEKYITVKVLSWPFETQNEYG